MELMDCGDIANYVAGFWSGQGVPSLLADGFSIKIVQWVIPTKLNNMRVWNQISYQKEKMMGQSETRMHLK